MYQTGIVVVAVVVTLRSAMLLLHVLTYMSILHLRTSCCLLVYPCAHPPRFGAVVRQGAESPLDTSCWQKEQKQASLNVNGDVCKNLMLQKCHNTSVSQEWLGWAPTSEVAWPISAECQKCRTLELFISCRGAGSLHLLTQVSVSLLKLALSVPVSCVDYSNYLWYITKETFEKWLSV